MIHGQQNVKFSYESFKKMSKDICDKKRWFFVDSHQQKTVKVEEEGKMKQKHHVQTKEINYLQVISDGKVIKESSQVPRNETLKIFHQNITGLGNKTNELYCHLHHDFPHILCISEHPPPEWIWTTIDSFN